MRLLADFVIRDIGCTGSVDGTLNQKQEYLKTGRNFLRTLSRDMGLTNCQVTTIPGGIAVCGDVVLTGTWEEVGGGMIILHPEDYTGCMTYRRIGNGSERFRHQTYNLDSGVLRGSYETLLNRLLALKKGMAMNTTRGMPHDRPD